MQQYSGQQTAPYLRVFVIINASGEVDATRESDFKTHRRKRRALVIPPSRPPRH
jgi:hypothetical protein